MKMIASFISILLLLNSHQYLGKENLLLKKEHNMVFVRGGSFLMGCQAKYKEECYKEEKPAHKETVTSFWISKYEVTNLEFVQFANANFYFSEYGNWRSWFTGFHQFRMKNSIEYIGGVFSIPKEFENCPVVNISVHGAKSYADWKSKKDKITYRLPTEAEWEFAARGGVKTKNYKYSGGNNLDEVAWHREINDKVPQPVGQKKPNELGIYDMTGNAMEWCSEIYSNYVKQGDSKTDKTKNKRGEQYDSHVHRGGDANANARPKSLRLTCRYGYGNGIYYNIGFRLAADKVN